MIILQCPECYSYKVVFVNSEFSEEDCFECEECNCVYPLSEMAWESDQKQVREDPRNENAKEGGNLMFELIHELYTILNKIKGFKAGYNSSVDNRIIIDYKTKRYIITLDEIENPSSDMTDDMKRFA